MIFLLEMPNKRLRIDSNCHAAVSADGVVSISIYNPVWQWETFVTWGFKTESQLDKELLHWGPDVTTDNEWGTWSGLHIPLVNRKQKRNGSLILLTEAPHTPFGAAVLAHEALHAAWYCLKDTGVKLEDEEVICYTQQFIVHRVLQAAQKTPQGVSS